MSTNSLAFSLQSPTGPKANSAITGGHWASTSKVPQVALAFWIIKIAATTLGETGGDALSMTLDLGYLLSTAIFMACLTIPPKLIQKLPNWICAAKTCD